MNGLNTFLVLWFHVHEDLHCTDRTLTKKVKRFITLQPDIYGSRDKGAYFADSGELFRVILLVNQLNIVFVLLTRLKSLSGSPGFEEKLDLTHVFSNYNGSRV